MGRVIAFNPKNGPVHEGVNKEPSGIGAELNRQSLPSAGIEKLHCELQAVITLLEGALSQISPLIATMNKLEGDHQIKRAFALARLEVECAKFTVARLDNLIGRV
jgi:hypothetical protein